MRSRPDVDIHMPSVVHPGDPIDVELSIESHSDTPIDFIHLGFDGAESYLSSPDDQSPERSRAVVQVGVRLREKGTLAAGKHPLQARFEVPLDAPPSYLGVCIAIRYEAHLHVAIPWWPDLHETYEILVEPRPAQRPAVQPQTATSKHDTGAPFLELSLSDTAFAVGDEITGAFAVGNAGADGLHVEISLLAIERAHTAAHNSRAEQFRFIVPTLLSPSRSGGEVPFRFHVPRNVVPSFDSLWCTLSWQVQAVLRGVRAGAVVCAIPVHIGCYSVPRELVRGRPEVGAARWRRTWSEVGAKHGLALAERGFALRGARGEVQIEVAHDSEDAPALVATLRYPSLQLGLRARPQFLVVLPSALELLLPAHKIECRDLTQGAAFLDVRLRAGLAPFKAIHIDDTQLSARKAGPADDAAAITSFVEATLALTDAVVSAIEQIPPPLALRDALPAWRAFAAFTGAHLAVGGMTLTGANVDGGVFDIATSFDSDGNVSATRIDFALDPPLVVRTQPDGSETFVSAAPGWRELVAVLRASVSDLAIRPQAITLDIAGPTQDPAELRPRLVEVLVLAMRLRGERTPGPYR